MRISKTLTPLALAALLVACSSEENVSQDILTEEGMVEIKLSAGGSGSTTRGSIESDADGLFEANGLGIFMLATHKLNINPDEQAISWDPAVNEWAVWWNNVEANAVKDVDHTNIDVTWPTGDKHRWYPVGSWYSYRFYAYYPRVADSEVTTTDGRRTVHYANLDGTTDIIWGRSLGADMSDTHEKYRYCARYFRQDGYGDKYPTLALEHKLMRLQFCVKGVADPNKPGHEYDDANTMMVKSVTLEAVPASATLIVCDRPTNGTGGDLAGTIEFDWSANATQNLNLRTNDGPFDPATSQVNNDDLIDIGDPIMLPVPDAKAVQAGFTHFKVWVDLCDTSGQVFPAERPIELQLDANKDFETGKTYRVVLQIAGPREVTLRATLQQWDDSDQGDVVNPLEFN